MPATYVRTRSGAQWSTAAGIARSSEPDIQELRPPRIGMWAGTITRSVIEASMRDREAMHDPVPAAPPSNRAFVPAGCARSPESGTCPLRSRGPYGTYS
jgi:hypothetical protein